MYVKPVSRPGGVSFLRMTNYSKFKALSIFAGVISLYFGLCVAAGLLVTAYNMWLILKIARNLGLVVGSNAFPRDTTVHVVELILMGILAVSAYWCRSRLRRRMTFERGSTQSPSPKAPSQHR
jgi:hypothetical protein